MAICLNDEDLVEINGGAYSGPVWKYQIQKGDCLSVIAQKTGTRVDVLCDINHITNPNLIKAGTILYIPAK